MASALMRRSALTAVLAAAATIFSPLSGIASAAAPALTAPTFSPASGGSSTVNRPTVSVAYNTPLDTANSSLTLTDATAGATVNCPVSFSNGNATIQCTPTSDLADGHSYTTSASVKNADDSSSRTDSATWTENLPTVVSNSPKDGDVVGNGATPITAQYDVTLSSASYITITDKDGNVLKGGSLSTSNPVTGHSNDTITYTPPALPSGTYAVHVHGEASPTSYTDLFLSYTVNSAAPTVAPTVTQAGYHGIDGKNYINGGNQKSVPFAGTAEPNMRVRVIISDSSVSTPLCSHTDPTKLCQNDRTANVGVAPCGQSLCPWSLTVDTTSSSTTPDKDYQYVATAYTAASSLSSTAATITKDTQAPQAPNSASASGDASDGSVNADNVLNVTAGDIDTSVATFKIVVTDVLKNTAGADSVNAATSGCSGGASRCVATPIDVKALQDGESSQGGDGVDPTSGGSSVSPALNVDVYARDLAGNLSNAKSTSADKESNALTPDFSKSYVTLGDNSTVPFSALSSSNANPPAIKTPASLTIWFNELIRPSVQDDSVPSSKTLYTTNVAVVSRTGFPISGTPSITDNGFSLTWKFSGAPTDSGSPYTVTNLVGVAGSCPDVGATSSNCDHYTDGRALAVFAIDTVAPNVHVTGVNGSGVNNGIDATDIGGTVISGTVDPDATQVSLTVQSASGGTAVVPASSVTITAPAAGQSLATWQTSPQNLSGLQDGTVTIVPRSADGAGNASSLDPTVNNPDGTARSSSTTMQARPTAPQALSAFGQNGQIATSWQAPANTGGHPLTGYTLTVTDTTINGSPQATQVAPTATAQIVSGLVNGHLYTVSLTAANDIGSGPAATSSATPKGAAGITLTAPSVINYGQSSSLHGKLTYLGTGLSTEKVTVTPYIGSKAGAAKTVTTDGFGNFAVTFKPARTTKYVASFAGDSAYGAASANRLVKVRVAIKITKVSAPSRSHLSVVTLTGNVAPNMHGRTVYIYEVVKGKSHQLAAVKLSSKSVWVYKRKFGKGTHYVYANFRTQNNYYGNNSSKVKFTRS